MHVPMRLVARHPVSLVIVLAAFAAVAAVFTFARPQYHRPYESKMTNLAEQDYISPKTVRAAFAREGLALRYLSATNLTVLSDVPSAEQGHPGKVVVVVGGRTGMIGLGPELDPYDERFDNVLVTYDGTNGATVDRVKAAVAALKG
jgi:hypothetical protein